MENLKKEIEEWTGRRRDPHTIPSPWPLVEGDYDFEQVIGKAKKSPDFFDILRACVLWEYGREMPTMRTLDAKWSELKISGTWRRRLFPFRFPETYGFPDKPWRALSSEAQAQVTSYLVEPEIYCTTDLNKAPTIISEMKRAKKLVLVIAVSENDWSENSPARIVDFCRTKLERCFADVATPRGSSNLKGRKISDLAKALRVLAYCRLQIHDSTEAKKLLERLKTMKTKIRSFGEARTQTNERAHDYFPWLSLDESALHTMTISDRMGQRD